MGPSRSPLPPAKTSNIFGSAFASIIAAAKIFAETFPDHIAATNANLLQWDSSIGNSVIDIGSKIIGNIWFVGGGSTGSATAYFLVLAGLKFDATVFDGDVVEVENLDRSPIFGWNDVRQSKAEVIAEFLRVRGIEAHAEPVWLDQSGRWKDRQEGEPDILISAANERNVRYAIETQLPPVQIYGTTGEDWQASMLRHIPPQDPCSCCRFPPDTAAITKCATGSATLIDAPGQPEQIDAALPFLSFAAGLMAAAEIAKLTIPSYLGRNRAFFTPCAERVFFARDTVFRDNCTCCGRNWKAHRMMISGSKYAALSKF